MHAAAQSGQQLRLRRRHAHIVRVLLKADNLIAENDLRRALSKRTR